MPTATKPCEMSIAEAAALLASRRLSPVELVESCLDRIDTCEADIQAWVLIDREGALARARYCSQELSRGETRGPLHGIPVGLKDIIFTAGMRTEAGSRTWKSFVPSYDAASVSRLRAAGAIIVGKTHTTEFAFADPAPTRNPWDLEHTPGGSSSGSAAAVAASMCLAALGTQTGGSTLRPAAYNGIVGLKPQHGRISAHGVVPISWAMDHVGILTRSVEDAALVLHAASGYNPRDPYSLAEPVPDYAAEMTGQVAPPRLGLARNYFFERADEEMLRHLDETVDRLRQAGAEVVETPLPASFATIPGTWAAIGYTDCASYHRDMFASRKDDYGPRVRQAIETGMETTGVRYAEAIQARLRQQADMEPVMGRLDAVLTPGATGPAPRDLTRTGDASMQMPWTLLGFPSLSLPSGLSESGLPLAVQLAAGPRQEGRLLAAARWCERVLDVNLRPTLP